MPFGRMGARGIANQDISPGFVMQISKATAEYTDSNQLAIGRDTRTSGHMLADAAQVGLMSAGVDVVRLGIVPTPSIQRYADENDISALQITASHNPPEYNGVKLIGDDGVVLDRSAVKQIRSMAESTELSVANWDGIGRSSTMGEANDEYVERIVAEVNTEPIAEHSLHVVLDPGHGAGSLTSPRLMRRIGCQVTTLNAQPDGRFPGRNPEPKDETLGTLKATVAGTDADIGIAHDGDADRVMVVDENGILVPGNTLLAVLADAVVSTGDVVVTAINTSQQLADVVENAGGSVEYTPIGNSYILSRVRELQDRGRAVPIAGEGNGGIIYPNHRLNRDGGYVAAKFLQLVSGQSVSEFVAPFARYHLRQDKISYDNAAERDDILSRASKWARESEGTVRTLDGHRVDFGESWALVRPSGTEPYIRIYAEANEPEIATGLVDRVRDEISH